MIINRTTLFVFLIIMTLTGFSCEGPVGPAGPEGPQGEKGDPGSVDIIYSDWSQLDWNLNDSSTYLYHKIEVNELTEEFIESGGVLLMYIKFENYIYPIPFSGSNDYINYEISLPGNLMISVGTYDGSGVEAFLREGEYRYVLIPGGVLTNGFQGKLNTMDYETMAAYFGLSDHSGIIQN